MKTLLNSLRPRQNGRHFADDTFKRFFQNENVWISIKISLKFVPNAPINNIPSLVQMMAWRRAGDKPSSEPMMVSLLTHICVTRPQRVNDKGPPTWHSDYIPGFWPHYQLTRKGTTEMPLGCNGLNHQPAHVTHCEPAAGQETDHLSCYIFWI